MELNIGKRDILISIIIAIFLFMGYSAYVYQTRPVEDGPIKTKKSLVKNNKQKEYKIKDVEAFGLNEMRHFRFRMYTKTDNLKDKEEIQVVFLNKNNKVICKRKITTNSLSIKKWVTIDFVLEKECFKSYKYKLISNKSDFK